jgi:REP element-mobilizing transposase RayT
MTQADREFRDEHIPFGYLITFRAFGTWLHGKGGSVDREYNKRLLTQRPVKLGSNSRRSVELAIRETCEIRKWSLWAFNIRSNHVHTVVSANTGPKNILSAFKANATRTMREAGQWRNERSPWARKAVSVIYGLSRI